MRNSVTALVLLIITSDFMAVQYQTFTIGMIKLFSSLQDGISHYLSCVYYYTVLALK